VFYNMTYREFILARMGHQRAEINTWRQLRLVLHAMQSLLGDSKHRKPLTQFMPLPFDDELAPSKDELEEKGRKALALIREYERKGILKPKVSNGTGTTSN